MQWCPSEVLREGQGVKAMLIREGQAATAQPDDVVPFVCLVLSVPKKPRQGKQACVCGSKKVGKARKGRWCVFRCRKAVACTCGGG